MSDMDQVFQDENDQRRREDTLDMQAEVEREKNEQLAALHNQDVLEMEFKEMRRDKVLAEEILTCLLILMEQGMTTTGDAETARSALRTLGVNVK